MDMESRLIQYSIPHFSFDNAKFHLMGNEDHSMGTRIYSMGNEVVRVHGVTRISVPKLGVLVSKERITHTLIGVSLSIMVQFVAVFS